MDFRKIVYIYCVLMLSACSFFSEPEREIRIGINAWPGYEYLYLAKQANIFEKHGVNAKIIEFNSLADTRRAFESKQIDIMGVTLVEVAYTVENTSIDPVVILITDYSNGGDALVTQPEIKNVRQLKGKKIGIEPASLGIFEAYKVLKKHGLTLADVVKVPIDQINTEELFLKKKIDAAFTYPPSSVKIRSKNSKVNFLWTSKDDPEEILDVVVSSRKFAEENADKINAIRKSFYEAVEFSKKSDQGYEIMAKRQGISAQEFKSIVSEDLVVLEEKDQAKFLANNGSIERIFSEVQSALVASGEFKSVKSVKIRLDK